MPLVRHIVQYCPLDDWVAVRGVCRGFRTAICEALKRHAACLVHAAREHWMESLCNILSTLTEFQLLFVCCATRTPVSPHALFWLCENVVDFLDQASAFQCPSSVDLVQPTPPPVPWGWYVREAFGEQAQCRWPALLRWRDTDSGDVTFDIEEEWKLWWAQRCPTPRAMENAVLHELFWTNRSSVLTAAAAKCDPRKVKRILAKRALCLRCRKAMRSHLPFSEDILQHPDPLCITPVSDARLARGTSTLRARDVDAHAARQRYPRKRRRLLQTQLPWAISRPPGKSMVCGNRM